MSQSCPKVPFVNPKVHFFCPEGAACGRFAAMRAPVPRARTARLRCARPQHHSVRNDICTVRASAPARVAACPVGLHAELHSRRVHQLKRRYASAVQAPARPYSTSVSVRVTTARVRPQAKLVAAHSWPLALAPMCVPVPKAAASGDICPEAAMCTSRRSRLWDRCNSRTWAFGTALFP